MKPAIPTSVDGIPLSAQARERLSRYVDAYHFDRPLRPAHRTLGLALACLRATCEVDGGEWRTLSVYRLASGRAVRFAA